MAWGVTDANVTLITAAGDDPGGFTTQGSGSSHSHADLGGCIREGGSKLKWVKQHSHSYRDAHQLPPGPEVRR